MGQQQDQEQERVLKRAFTLQRLSYLIFYIIFCLIFHLIFCLIFCLIFYLILYSVLSSIFYYVLIFHMTSSRPFPPLFPPLRPRSASCKAFQLILEICGAPQLLIITKCNFRISATPIFFLHHSVFLSNAVLSSY